MSRLLLLMLLTLACCSFRGKDKVQPDVYHSIIDTLKVSGDTTFVRICKFKNDSLENEHTGFMIPDTVDIKPYGLFQLPTLDALNRIVKGKPLGIIPRSYRYAVSRVIRHGTTTDFTRKCIETEEFHFGKLVRTDYFLRDTQPASQADCSYLMIDCCMTAGEYIIIQANLGPLPRGIKRNVNQKESYLLNY